MSPLWPLPVTFLWCRIMKSCTLSLWKWRRSPSQMLNQAKRHLLKLDRSICICSDPVHYRFRYIFCCDSFLTSKKVWIDLLYRSSLSQCHCLQPWSLECSHFLIHLVLWDCNSQKFCLISRTYMRLKEGSRVLARSFFYRWRTWKMTLLGVNLATQFLDSHAEVCIP